MIGVFGAQRFDAELQRTMLEQLHHPSVNVYELAKTLTTVKKTAVYSASVLLATGSATMSGRKVLIVRNVGEITAVVGPSSTSSTPSKGDKIAPGEMAVYTFDGSTTVDLYVRSVGYSTELEVSEG